MRGVNVTLVRIVLNDGASVIANWNSRSLGGRGSSEELMVTLTAEEAVERLPAGSVKAILPFDRGVPLPGDTLIYRFATLA